MRPDREVEQTEQVEQGEHEDYTELRSAVEAAYEQEESGGSDADPTQQVRADGTEEPPRAGRQRDQYGRFAPNAAAPEDTAERDLEAAGYAPQEADADVAEPVRAPQSWRADAREHWNRLPPQVQAEVMRREHETSNVLNQTAEERKIAHAFREAVSPFEAMVRAEGSDPVRATAALFKTAYQLRQGTPQSKAQLVAEMVQQYGIDLDMLDQSLAARMTGQQQPQQQYAPQAPPRDPRMDQLLGGLQQIHQQQQLAEAQEANAMIGGFAQTHEFFADVREEMADLIEVAQRRGIELSLEDAYNRAVQLNPATAAVLGQRGPATQPQQSVARARNAASSVRSQPSGTSVAPREPATLRAAIEAAMDGQ